MKGEGSDKYLHCIQQTLKGWDKEGPHTSKKLLVEADVPELMVKWGLLAGAAAVMRESRDLMLGAFYFLLRIGEYTMKHSRNESKQTVQFQMADVTFFHRNKMGQCDGWYAPVDMIMEANRANLKIENQKNVQTGMCIHHEANDIEYYCPVKALGC
ncbi:LOW QUALITY PROTEIN: hypothetical protein ACHAW6_011493 [Cyclotella cf. meneghiniana]